jgi:hypothetical protein
VPQSLNESARWLAARLVKNSHRRPIGPAAARERWEAENEKRSVARRGFHCLLVPKAGPGRKHYLTFYMRADAGRAARGEANEEVHCVKYIMEFAENRAKGKHLVSAGARWSPARLPATVIGGGASRKRHRARRMEWRTWERVSPEY